MAVANVFVDGSYGDLIINARLFDEVCIIPRSKIRLIS